MNLLAIGVAGVLAAATLPLVEGLAPDLGRTRASAVIPMAVVIAGFLGWAVSQIAVVRFPSALALGVVASVLAWQSVIDLAVHRLPRELSYLGLAVLLIAVGFSGGSDRLGGVLIGLAAMTAVTGLLVVLTRGSLGVGDLHLAPLLGALVGWFSPPLVALAWGVTALSGAVVVIIGLAAGRLRRSDHIPYGPFMILGSLVAVLVGAISVS